MVNETAQVQPTNKIVWDSRNLHVQTKKIETVANCYPGRLVKAGTNDDDVLVTSGASQGYGWLSYEHTTKKYRPATISTIYVVNDQAAIVNGPGIGVLATIGAFTAAISKGTLLTSAATGILTIGVAGTDDIVAIAEEGKAYTAAAQNIMVRSRI